MNLVSLMNMFSANEQDNLSGSVKKSAKGEFDGVFKKYLDRGNSDSAKDVEKAEKFAEKLEKTIDDMDIPEDEKKSLKESVRNIESSEDAREFVEKLAEVVEEYGLPYAQVFKDMADSVFLKEAELAVDVDGQSTGAEELEKKLQVLSLLKGSQGNAEKVSQEAVDLDEFIAKMKNNGEKAAEKLGVKVSQNSDEDGPEIKITQDSSKSADEAEEAVKSETASQEDGSDAQADEFLDNKPEFRTTTTLKADNTSKEDNILKFETLTEVKDSKNAQNQRLYTEVKVDKPRDILKIAEYVEVAKSQGSKKLTVQLQPANLGKVNIELVEHAGKVSARVLFDIEVTKNMMAAQMESLKQQFQEKGIQVEKMEFIFTDMKQHDEAARQFARNRRGKNGRFQNQQQGGAVGEAQNRENTKPRGLYA